VSEGRDWTAPEELIRRLRTFELTAVPGLATFALCDLCTGGLRWRRRRSDVGMPAEGTPAERRTAIARA
jgi:hypothetical protein